jgi:serine O-acetyltransferase
MTWMQTYCEDLRRYKTYRKDESTLVVFLTEQGLWALLQYRIASVVHRSSIPAILKLPLLALLVGWKKLIEILTGISIPAGAIIGPGFYVGHFGNIFISDRAVIGRSCNISQGVTIGISGRGEKRGVPTLGDRVYIGANAILVGKIRVGDGAVIAAGALVNRDVPNGAVMLGNPAQIVSDEGSADYIQPDET